MPAIWAASEVEALLTVVMMVPGTAAIWLFRLAYKEEEAVPIVDWTLPWAVVMAPVTTP